MRRRCTKVAQRVSEVRALCYQTAEAVQFFVMGTHVIMWFPHLLVTYPIYLCIVVSLLFCFCCWYCICFEVSVS